MSVRVEGDSLSSLQKALDLKEISRKQLREQLDLVERETRAKLLEIDAFNTQLKVMSITRKQLLFVSIKTDSSQTILKSHWVFTA